MEEWLHFLIGSNPETILWWQMVVRAIFIFFVALILVRFGGKRIFGKNTSFDIVLGVILGSILSRALTANAKFVPTICAATALVLLHMLLAKISFYSRIVGFIIKGSEDKLIDSGEIMWRAMAKNSLTKNDLMEALRVGGGTDQSDKVRAAFIERSGQVSVIKKN